MNDSTEKLISVANEISKNEKLSFLRLLDEYINTIQTDPFLVRVLDLMADRHEIESIKLLKAGNRSSSDFDSFLIREEIQPQVDEQYPILDWKRLLDARKRFDLVKDYDSEDAIPDVTITLPEEETTYGTLSPTKVNLSRIPYSVELRGWKEHFRTFHNGFMALLDEINAKGGIFSKYFDFDPQTGTLYFQGSEIKINERKKTTLSHHLLTYLFNNEPFERHFYSELEEAEALLESKSWSSYYRTCEDIQAKVEAATGVNDFLDFNSGPKMYVRINPKYSSG